MELNDQDLLDRIARLHPFPDETFRALLNTHFQDRNRFDDNLMIIIENDDAAWSLVEELLRKFPESSDRLFSVLKKALKDGSYKSVKVLLASVVISRSHTNDLLFTAVDTKGDRKKMVRLCVNAGVFKSQSTTSFFRLSSIELSCLCGDLPLVKALYTYGATSNRELFHLDTRPDLKSRLEGRGCEGIAEFLHEVARTPRSLKALCRLAVASSIQSGHCHFQRVVSLPLPTNLKQYVLFDDVVL